ncbi:MAG: hypothetical protein U5R31_02980 [Acidimicrobiia bacterium]|nr:hypothetical protein [Acidimicrobiia bacterium]
MTWQAIGTVTIGILTAVVMLSAAVTGMARLWRYPIVRWVATPVTFTIGAIWDAWDQRRYDALADKIRPIIADEVDRLMQPNGGNSVADVSEKVDEVKQTLDRHIEWSTTRHAELDEVVDQIHEETRQ